MKRTFIYYLLTYAIFSCEAYACNTPECTKEKQMYVYIKNVIDLMDQKIPESWSIANEPCLKNDQFNRAAKFLQEFNEFNEFNDNKPTTNLMTRLMNQKKLCQLWKLELNNIQQNLAEIRAA